MPRESTKDIVSLLAVATPPQAICTEARSASDGNVMVESLEPPGVADPEKF